MKALTLWQPWASLVALGVKTIETRSWSTSYRGPLAIHAAKRRPDVEMMEDGPAGEIWDFEADECLVQWGPTDKADFIQPPPAPEDRWWLTTAPNHLPSRMPLGQVVARCDLVDVVPMSSEIPSQDEWREPWRCVTVDPWPILNTWPGFGLADGRYIGDQRPYGDFRPGRFAWLLDNIVPYGVPVTATGRQGLWEWKP